jgi:hypothetical protein
MIAVAPSTVPLHSAEFAHWTNSEAAQRAVLDGAKALAMTALDVLTQPELRTAARRAFETPADPSPAEPEGFRQD